MTRIALALTAAVLTLCTGCFSAQGGAERNRERIRQGMHRDEVFWELGKPKDAHPIPGQGDSPDLAVERWRYQWNYTPGKTLTLVCTAFIGAFFMDFNPYGFDIGFGRDGRVRTISEVGPRPR
jgi:hypothetical protein